MSMKKPVTAEMLGLHNNPDSKIPQIVRGNLDVPKIPRLNVEVLSDKSVLLDLTKAGEYIDLPVFAGEREVSDHHVQFLYDEMRVGNFNPSLVIIATAVMQGVVYKINGQHTCWAVAFMDSTEKGYSIQVRELRYRATSKEQLKKLYSTFDRIKPRSDKHLVRVHLAESTTVEGIWANRIGTLVSGMRTWLYTTYSDRNRITPEQLAADVEKRSALFSQVGLFTQPYHSGNPTSGRNAVLAACFATFDKVPTKAAEFWQPVFDGLGLDSKSDPRWKLRELLLSVSLRKAVTRATRVMDSEEITNCCLLAWNKWRKGESSAASLRAPNERPRLV